MNNDPKSDRLVKVHLNLRLLPFLVIGLFIWQLITPSKVWVVLLVALGGAWFLGFIWTKALAKNLHLKREMRYGWAQVGDHLQERFTLTNSGSVPGLWVEVIDHSDLPGSSTNRVNSILEKAKVQWITEKICSQRGVFSLGPTTLRTGDPIGVYSAVIEYTQQTGLMVMPPIVPLPEIEIAAGGRAGEGRRLKGDIFEETVSASGVREYHPTDALGQIHWPTSARKGKLYTRQFDSSPASDWWIFLDLEHLVQVGMGWDSTEEHGVILAASLSDRALRQGRAVGLVATGKELIWLPPKGDPGQRLNILRALTLVEPGTLSLSQLLKRVSSSFTQGTSLILITPNINGQWIENMLPLKQKGVTPTVLCFDPVSFGGEESPAGLQAQLTKFGIRTHIISRELFDQPEARPGQQGAWEWKILGTGRAIAVQRPKDTDWKPLS